MKSLLILALMFLSVSMRAQTTTLSNGNGGLQSENTYAKVVYKGYANGFYCIEITDKRCPNSYKVSWLGKDTTFSIAVTNGVLTVNLPGAWSPNMEITVKPSNKCAPGDGDLGNLEVFAPSSLPCKFKPLSVKKVDGRPGYVQIDFEVYDVADVNLYRLQVSFDGGKTYVDKMVVFSDKLQPNKKYSYIIKLRKQS